MGTWGFGYDTLNRLVTSQNTATTPTSTQYASNYGCWSYDAFGNRLSQSMSTTPCIGTLPMMSWANYNANNQFTATSQALGGVPYDAAGNVLNDGQNQYLYDAEGRICAVASTPMPGMTGYLYDADGTRVAKGRISTWSCDPGANGFQTTNDYILGPSGEQVTEMGMGGTSNGATTSGLTWQHTNVYAAGSLIATYDNDGLHFYLNDPLGTRRAQTNYTGVLEQTCSSLPFGDGLVCTGSTTYPTEHHFTGKERDTESGNDYFVEQMRAGRAWNSSIYAVEKAGASVRFLCTRVGDPMRVCTGIIDGSKLSDSKYGARAIAHELGHCCLYVDYTRY
jgi:hypothetical protein